MVGSFSLVQSMKQIILWQQCMKKMKQSGENTRRLFVLFGSSFAIWHNQKIRGGIKLEVRVKGYAHEGDWNEGDWSEHESNVIANTPEQTQEQMEWLKKVASTWWGPTKETGNKIMTKDDTSEQNNDRYVTKVQEAPNGDLFVELPRKLIDQLGWEV